MIDGGEAPSPPIIGLLFGVVDDDDDEIGDGGVGLPPPLPIDDDIR